MVIQILIVVFLMFALWRLVVQFRAKSMTPKFFFLWGALWILGVCVVLYPEAASRVAGWVGVGRGADMVLYVVVLLVLYVQFRFAVRVERIERSLSRLTTEQALRASDDEISSER